MSTNRTPLHPEQPHSLELEFSDKEFADLESAAEVAGFDSVDSFVRAATLHATRSRRLKTRVMPPQQIVGFPFFVTEGSQLLG